MEFVEAMGIAKRMCMGRRECTGCPFSFPEEYVNCLWEMISRPEEAEEILTKWNAENPVKTLKDVFNESFPNAPKHGSRAPDIPADCVSKAGYTPLFQSDECCETNCIKCWNQPYEQKTK